MSTYSEKFKDPRWQKKRLEILERDKWTCQICKDTTNTLEVHHKLYFPKLEPWEYPNNSLITLCEKCHSVENIIVDFLLSEIKQYLQLIFYSDSLGVLKSGMESYIPCKEEDNWLFAKTLGLIFFNEQFRAFVVNNAYNIFHGDTSILKTKVKRVK